MNVQQLRQLEQNATAAPWGAQNIENDAVLIGEMRNALPHLLNIAEVAKIVSSLSFSELDDPGKSHVISAAVEHLRDALARFEQA